MKRLFLFLFLLFIVFGAEQSKSVAQQPAAGLNAQPGNITDLKEVNSYDILLFTAANKLKETKISSLNSQKKILIIDFWATWCGPCRQSIPHLIEVQEKYKNKGVEVIGLSIEAPEIKAKILAFKKTFGINYRLGFASKALFGTFDPTGALPQTFIFDRKGNLLRQIRGFHSTKVPQFMQETIEKALNEETNPKS